MDTDLKLSSWYISLNNFSQTSHLKLHLFGSEKFSILENLLEDTLVNLHLLKECILLNVKMKCLIQ